MGTSKYFKKLCIVLAVTSNFLASSCQQSLIDKVNQKYEALKMNKALPLYKKVLNTKDFSNVEKADASQKIARIFYKGYNKPDSAVLYAEKGFAIANESQKQDLLRSMVMYYKDVNKDSAWQKGLRLLSVSHNNKDSVEALSLLREVKVSEIETTIFNHKELQDSIISSALRIADLIYVSRPESPENNEKRIELLLLKGNYSGALLAIRVYFFLGDDPVFTKYYQSKTDSLNLLIQNSQVDEHFKVELIKLLGEFRFYKQVLILGNYYKIETKTEIDETLAYAQYKMAFEKAVNKHYSDILIDEDNDKQFARQLDSCNQYLWNRMNGCKEKQYDYESFLHEARKRFGMNTFQKERGDYHIYILGESVYQTNENVVQYGYNAPFNYYLVDHIVGTNVRGYLYEYFEWGGWSEKGEVNENRRLVLEGTITKWEKICQKTTAQIDSICHSLEQRDDSVLRNKEIADLPALRERFEWQALKYIYDSLEQKGYSGTDLHKKFISQIRLDEYLSSTLAHEGRHVIDTKYNIAGNDHVQTEFTANFSSIAFAPVPQMSLSRVFIYDPESKDPTGHGKADTKIVEGFLTWMKAHKTEIKGFDQSRPVLSQADKLTKDQIITVCHELDPLCRKLLP
jgi:hypothetical protein